MSRRTYDTHLRCAEKGCPETTWFVSNSQRERAETEQHYAKKPWRCTRHVNPGEVLTDSNREIETSLVSEERPTGLYWGGRQGFVSGPGFKAFAKDFPAGTRLVVTARIEHPEVSA